MFIKLNIPESIVERYYKADAQGDPVIDKDKMKAVLDRFSEVDLSERIVIIDQGSRSTLEELLSRTLVTPQDVIDSVRKTKQIAVGSVKVNISPRLLVMLKDRAEAYNTPLKDIIREHTIMGLSNHVGSLDAVI